jgi:hypothetical protein
MIRKQRVKRQVSLGSIGEQIFKILSVWEIREGKRQINK